MGFLFVLELSGGISFEKSFSGVHADLRSDRCCQPGDSLFILSDAKTLRVYWGGAIVIWICALGTLPKFLSFLWRPNGEQRVFDCGGAATVYCRQHDYFGARRSQGGE